MKVDIQDVLFWMDAIRDSDDRYRTLESFWKGQVNSKVWLIDNLEKVLFLDKRHNIVIHGGWNGVLSSLLFNSNIDIKHITSIDIDPICEKVAKTINRRQDLESRFSAITADMCSYQYDADIVINTSCEHITQEQYNQWLKNVPKKSLVVIQSNDYRDLEEHVNCVDTLQELEQKSNLKIIFSDKLALQKYNRFMVIGYKNE
jgi:hypothetical protein